MTPFEKIIAFYLEHLPEGTLKDQRLTAPCPFCGSQKKDKPGQIVVFLNPESYFRGYFRCTHHCVPDGFHVHFGRLMGVDAATVPGFDPDGETYVVKAHYPSRNLSAEMDQFASLMSKDQYQYFARYGIPETTLKTMKVGFNGRYLVYPYIQPSGYAYAARCVLPDRQEDHFWHGNETFAAGEFTIYNAPEIDHCEGGTLFITDGELNLLILKALGYPAIAVPSAADLTAIVPERLARVKHLFLLVAQAPEARLAARELAVRFGFKARIPGWPNHVKRGDHLA